ncbi:MAG: NADH/ubiquinone/plastoquinone (complex I) [Candidatus Marinimicrobia bacterium]|nr:NADH/ubiquinone/plastoquinone (complex I) [Candidatus Neomarinimicrobiota bacterium]
MILPFFVIIPLLAAFLITLISGKKDNWAIILSILAELSVLVLAVFCYFFKLDDVFVYSMSGWKIPYTICLVQDALSCFMLIVVSTIALVSLIFSVTYIRHLVTSWRYYALFMLLVTGMNGVIVTGDLFNLFVFMEIALFSAYALVSYGRKAEEFEAAFKYAIMGSVSSSLILVGIAITYSYTSSLTMATIAETLKTKPVEVTYWLGGLFLAGFGLKAAMVPFHAWLPDAHSSAPAPISSMLSGVLIKSLGVYTIVRLFFNVFGAPALFGTLLLVFGTLSIIVASFLAIGQWDIKRLLAYSSISQIGFILVGFGVGNFLGILGAIFHLLSHAVFKSLLFYNTGAVEMALGTRDMRQMGDLRKALPVTSFTSMVGSLAIMGMPPFNGFFSKLFIIMALIKAKLYFVAFLVVGGSILTIAYFVKFQRYGFRGDRVIEKDMVKEPISFGMKFSMGFLAVLCLLTSVMLIPGIREAVIDPVINVIANKTGYIQSVLSGR